MQFLVMLYSVGAWLSRDIFEESYCWWILFSCNMDCITFNFFWLSIWHRADRLWWVFFLWGGYHFLIDLNFLELMLCSLGSCCDGGCLLKSLFCLNIHDCHYWWLLLDVASNERFFSLHYMDSRSLGTVQGRLAFNTENSKPESNVIFKKKNNVMKWR